MQIFISEVSGFCFGVKRAYSLCQKYFGKNFQTLGPLIHNPEILKKIEESGGKIVENLEDLNSENVIIRAHGISREKFKQLKKFDCHIEDTTCPFVNRLQNSAKRFYEEGFQIIIVGRSSHPEIKSITEDIKDAIVIFSKEEVEKLPHFKKIAVISQTTERLEKVEEIIQLLKKKSDELKSENTICTDVKNRQKAAEELSLKVDLMLVIGGKESSNTGKLFEICKKNCSAFLIENEKDIKKEYFLNCEKIGICSGSSTPMEVV